MFPGVRPIISFAWTPTATILPVSVLNATTDGSFSAIPRPRPLRLHAAQDARLDGGWRALTLPLLH
jgi:hypothetical protein